MMMMVAMAMAMATAMGALRSCSVCGQAPRNEPPPGARQMGSVARFARHHALRGLDPSRALRLPLGSIFLVCKQQELSLSSKFQGQ